MEGINGALKRCKAYLKTGAEGLFIEGVETVEDLETIGKTFDVPLAANMLEGEGKTPIIRPDDLKSTGFTMVLYPTNPVFRIAQAIERALDAMQDQWLDLAGPIMTFRRLRAGDRPPSVEGDRAARRRRARHRLTPAVFACPSPADGLRCGPSRARRGRAAPIHLD